MSVTVLMAGGGTGGHVFPMIAVAHALRRLRPDVRPVFIGTSRGMETRAVPEQGFELELLDVLPIRGGGARGALRGALRALELIPESRRLVRRLSPVGVFSIGGYAAGPISLAARTLGLPVALMEPNSVIGLANQLLAPFVARAYTAFAEAEPAFSPAVVRALGVPLRPGFAPRPYRRAPGRLRVLVLGGSQGAKALNEALPEAFRHSAERLPGLEVLHQCGARHVDAVTAAYAGLSPAVARVVTFIDDVPAALADADLVVGRSGASAVSEITAVGRPSLLVPYPFASGDHQRVNARALERAGAAVLVPSAAATSERLARELEALALADGALERMAAAARAFGRPGAAREVALDFLRLVGLEAATEPTARSEIGESS